jgi:hypothetical protein
MMSHIDAWATLAAMVGLTLDMIKRNDSEAFQSFLVKSRANATTEFEGQAMVCFNQKWLRSICVSHPGQGSLNPCSAGNGVCNQGYFGRHALQ